MLEILTHLVDFYKRRYLSDKNDLELRVDMFGNPIYLEGRSGR